MIRDIAFDVAAVRAVIADAHAVGTVNGAAVDTNFANGVRMLASIDNVGASGTIEAKIQDSDDGTTGWADVVGATTGVLSAVPALLSEVIVFNLLGSDTAKHKRFVRGVFVVAVNAVDASALFEVYGHKVRPNPL